MLNKPIQIKKGADFTFVVEVGDYSFADFTTASIKFNKNSDGILLKELTKITGGGITADSNNNLLCKLSKTDTALAVNDFYDIVLTLVLTSGNGGNTIIEEYKKFIEIKS